MRIAKGSIRGGKLKPACELPSVLGVADPAGVPG